MSQFEPANLVHPPLEGAGVETHSSGTNRDGRSRSVNFAPPPGPLRNIAERSKRRAAYQWVECQTPLIVNATTAKETAIMDTRQLGTSDLHITPIGFGAWAIGGSGREFGWGAQDDRHSIPALREAHHPAINWINPPAIYAL